MAASLPGQNIDIARRFWRIAVSPDRLAAPPGGVANLVRRHRESPRHRRRRHRVRHDAVVSGIQAGHDGVVIGKRLRRKGRNQFFRADTACRERFQIRGVGAVGVVPPPPVERDEDDDRIASLRVRARQRRRGPRAQRQAERGGASSNGDSRAVVRAQATSTNGSCHRFAGISRSSSSVQLTTTFSVGAFDVLSFFGNLITRKRPSGATS